MSEEIYPLGRDETESKRLNEQHALLIEFVEGVIDKTIPLENIHSVADVATGTGIWLWDVQKLLNEKLPDPNRYFHGFDISAAQFPPAPEGINLSVQDIFEPFSAEHHNRYDLVSVRLLVAGIPESAYQAAVDNLLAIMKPGGYLQWMEIDWDAAVNEDPRFIETRDAWLNFLDLNNLSRNAPAALYERFKNAGLVNVVNRAFRPKVDKDLIPRTQKWQWQFMSSVMPVVMLKMGRANDPTEAGEKATELLQGLKSMFDEGKILDTRFGVVIGQKQG